MSLNAISQKNTEFWKKIFHGVISDVIFQLSLRYSFYSSKIDLPYPTLPLLPGPLLPGVVVPDKGPIYGLNRIKLCFELTVFCI